MHPSHMHIKHWPEGERPREKLLSLGPAELSNAELLAIFLGSGLKGTDAVETARRLLEDAGDLRGLLDRGPDEMLHLPGLGPARTCRLTAALELSRRHLEEELQRGTEMTTGDAVRRYFISKLRPRKQEVFAALFLDTKYRAVAFEELFNGTIDRATVHPREVLRRALAHNATAVIVGHNHPSGHPEPSAADRSLTERLHSALGLVDIRLLDHYVIGEGEAISMAARGWV